MKTFWLRPSLIYFVRVGMLLWNIETDKRCIVVELYQFLSIYYWLVRIFNSSDDALLIRAKHQKILRKTWISRLDLHLITSDWNDLDYPDAWLKFIFMSPYTPLSLFLYHNLLFIITLSHEGMVISLLTLGVWFEWSVTFSTTNIVR